MIRALLRRGDGLSSGRIWLRTVVKRVQSALVDAGIAVGPDGKFGSKSEKAVKEFQQRRGLGLSGILDRATWTALGAHLDTVDAAENERVAEFLVKFAGDLDWVHERESHAGRPYWPKGRSGVTLDPGVDLGHASPEVIESLYAPLLTQAQMKALRTVFGIKGEDARAALNAVPGLPGIRISREQAARIMPFAARPYWDGISRRFPAIKRQDTPASVQTVLLSLAYNRGVFNRHLEKLGEPLRERRWSESAELIGKMQQSHELRGIRLRRRYEASLIRDELQYLAS